MKPSIPVCVAVLVLAGCGTLPQAQSPTTQPLVAQSAHLTVPPASQIAKIGPTGKVKLGDAYISLIPSPSMVQVGGMASLWPQIMAIGKTVSLAEFQWMPSCGTVDPGITYEDEMATFMAPSLPGLCTIDADVMIAYTDGTTDSGWVSTSVTVTQ